jgi:DnaJ-class molecular chaperone
MTSVALNKTTGSDLDLEFGPGWWKLSVDQLETVYRKLCKKYHPDCGIGEPEVLTDNFQKLQDIYTSIKSYRADPVNIDAYITLSELYHGCIKEIMILDHAGYSERLPIVIAVGSYHDQVITLVTDTFKTVNVKIIENNNTRFVRDGYNLSIHLDITLTQAILGEPILVGHFDRIIRVPTKIPHTNYRHIIPGMGMPINEGRYGDLYICYQVIFPSEITEDLVQELLTLKY